MTVESPQATAAAPTREVGVALRRAAVQASRAPSVHNTQPWRFVLRGDVVEVHADWTRNVPSYDPQGRQLLMSCGCAVLNMRAALAAAGWAADVERFPDARRRQVVATVVPHADAAPEPGLARLDRVIGRRRTNRNALGGAGVSAATLSALADAAAAEEAALVALSGQGRATFDEVTALANRLHDADIAYRAELRAWTMPERGRRDGVPGGHAEISSLPGAGENLDRPACLVLVTEADDHAAWLRAGEALERVLLVVTASDLAARPMTQAVEVPELRDRLRAATGQRELHPQVAVLLGEAPPGPATRRRRLVDVITEVA